MKLQTICTLALAGTLMIGLSLSATAAEKTPVNYTVTATDAPDDPTDGAGIYKKYCKGCHLADGSGKPSRVKAYTEAGEKFPNFKTDKKSAADVVKAVKNGRTNKKVAGTSGKMKKFSDTTKKKWLTEAQMKAVADYVSKM